MLQSNVHRRHRPGFTLFEVLIASTILALAVIALTQAVLAGQMQTHAAMRSGRAVSLCNAMIEEILTKAYPNVTPQSADFASPDIEEARFESGSKDAYDTLDDYHGYTEPAQSPKHDARGSDYPDIYDRFRRQVTITDSTMEVPGTNAQVPGLTITVTVQDGIDGRQWTLSRFVPDPDPDEE